MEEQIEVLKTQGMFQLGVAYFKKPTTRSDVGVFLERKYQRVLRDICWKFQECQHDFSRWHFIFQLIHIAAVKGLIFRSIQENMNFIKEILHIQMPYLLDLNLSDNRIQNVESLVFLDAPNLQKINLTNNNITKITNILNKLYFKKLRGLSIKGNQINSIEISRLQEQERINFDLQISKYLIKTNIQDISFLAKSKTLLFDGSIKGHTYYSKKSIKQERCCKVLMQKVKRLT